MRELLVIGVIGNVVLGTLLVLNRATHFDLLLLLLILIGLCTGCWFLFRRNRSSR